MSESAIWKGLSLSAGADYKRTGWARLCHSLGICVRVLVELLVYPEFSCGFKVVCGFEVV